jgi:hypothetical protein
MDYENFQVQIAQSPILSAYAGYIAPSVIIGELVVSSLLVFRKTVLTGLHLATGLMVAFTVYIFLILNYSEFIPCSCGGVLEKLGWTEHLIFNLVFVALGISSIWIKENLIGNFKKLFILRLILLIIIPCSCVIVLYSSSEHIMKKENPFIRRFIPHAIKAENAYDLGFNSYYFAGYADGEIYLGNYTTPLVLTVIDTALVQERSNKIQLDENNHLFRSIQIKVKSPHYYVYDGSIPIIYKGKIKSNFAKTMSFEDVYFTQMEVADSLHFLFNTKSTTTKSRVLAFLKLDNEPDVQINFDLLQGHLDGIFDTDGRLIADNLKEDFVYVYYYRNEIPVFDKNLILKRKLRTIDTISQAHIKVKKLSSGISKMEAPPLKVNDKSVLHQGILFNQSNLRGKFESSDLWTLSSIIDVYDIEKKMYLGSFFIQNRGKEKMTQMLVIDKKLYVLSGKEIVQYQFAQNVLNFFN